MLVAQGGGEWQALKMTIEKTADRVVAHSETLSLPAGLTLVASLMAWMAVAGMNLPGAWVDGSWARASRPLIAIGLGTLAFGGSALFALGHQRITLSTAGLENAWVVFRPIRRRFVPLADITSIDTVRIAGDEIHSTYLSVRSKTR